MLSMLFPGAGPFRARRALRSTDCGLRRRQWQPPPRAGSCRHFRAGCSPPGAPLRPHRGPGSSSSPPGSAAVAPDPPGRVRCRSRSTVELRVAACPPVPGVRRTAASGVSPGVGVDEFALVGAAQQRLVGVLAVDVDKPFAELRAVLQGRGPAVDVGPRAALAAEGPPQQAVIARCIEFALRQPVARRGNGRQVKTAR
jgi:hypothetical protein